MKRKNSFLIMQSFYIMIIIFAICKIGYTQDVIVKKSGETVKCKIIEEDSSKLYIEIMYKGQVTNTFVNKENIDNFKYASKTIDVSLMPYRDIVYTKNGSIIKGIIIEQIPNISVKLQTLDGSIFIADDSDIEKISRESVVVERNNFEDNCYQDVILKKSGETIHCKIIEEDSSQLYIEIMYKDKPINTKVNKQNIIDFSYGTEILNILTSPYRDVVYTKNGSIIKGVILDKISDNSIKIQNIEGNTFVFDYSDIEKIIIEPSTERISCFGGIFSYGLAVGGGGIFGIPLRFGGSDFSIEAGVYFRPYVEIESNRTKVFPGVMFSGGPAINLAENDKYAKSKIVKNGIALRGGYSVGTVNTAIFSFNWIHESFKKNNPKHSFIFELGPGISYVGSYYRNERGTFYKSFSSSYFAPMVYWKCHWNDYK
ncbi:MAG: hypothetical protein JXB49_04935 [Bacteroidales bacterium]|nr:hypothetical protein [Bacteroidales bacterium]